MGGMLGDVTDRMRARMIAARVGNLDRQNTRLQGEISLLRSELNHEREEHEEFRNALRARSKVVKVKDRSLLRVLVIGAGAYLLGARAGHERYDQIMTWFRSARDRLRGTAAEVASETQMAVEVGKDRVDLAAAEAQRGMHERESARTAR
jgi:hypothetical protein